MRVLIVGGTSFVGRGVAWTALNAGHDVTVINRGKTPSDPPGVRDATRQSIVQKQRSALDGLSFDVTVDAIAYRPVDVDALASVLGTRGGHHIQISSVSAYNDPPSEGATEETLTIVNDTDLAPDAEVTGETLRPAQGGLRTLGRRAFRRATHDRATDLRDWQPRRDDAVPLLGGAAAPRRQRRGAGTARQRLAVHRRARLGRVRAHHRRQTSLGVFHAAGP